MEKISFFIMLVLALVGGVVYVVCDNNEYKLIKKIQYWFIYSLISLFFMNTFRCAILKGDLLVNYTKHVIVLIADITIIFLGYFNFQGVSNTIVIRKHNKQYPIIFLLIDTILFLIVGVFYCFQYHNIKKAIYGMMMPKVITGVILISMFISMIINSVINSGFDSNLQKNKIQQVWKKFLRVQFIILGFIVTVVIYPFCEIYLTNREEFAFGIKDICFGCIGIFLIAYCLLNVLVFLLGNKKNIILTILFAFTCCCYIQEMFLNKGLFLMDGSKGQWGGGLICVNIIFWFMLIGGILFFNKNGKIQGVIKFVSVALVLMQTIGIISILVSGKENENFTTVNAADYFSQEGIFEVAQKENVVVFVLDTYDVDFLDEILVEQPNFLNPLKGFTYFPDMVSQFSRTFPSITYMLTGNKYFYDIPMEEYYKEAFDNISFWTEMSMNEYELYFYVEDSAYIGKQVKEQSANYVDIGQEIKNKISFLGLMKSIYQINNYRLLPYALKDYYNYTEASINEQVIQEREWAPKEYVVDDINFYEDLKQQGITIGNDDKAFRFYHLNGAHPPYVINVNGEQVDAFAGSRVEQCIWIMNVVYSYLEDLKKIGAYENTTIIITADHGENFNKQQLEQNTNPILFIKPMGVGDDIDLTISDTYASQEDILPTIAAICKLPMIQTEGLNLFDSGKITQNRVRKHYYTIVEDNEQVALRTYLIKGSSLNFDNWEATDDIMMFAY